MFGSGVGPSVGGSCSEGSVVVTISGGMYVLLFGVSVVGGGVCMVLPGSSGNSG